MKEESRREKGKERVWNKMRDEYEEKEKKINQRRIRERRRNKNYERVREGYKT